MQLQQMSDVTVPVADSSPDASPDAAAARGSARGAALGVRSRVLIADDHTIMREGLRALLESDKRLEVVGAVDNGREAVRSAVALKPDLLLMDIAMPDMDGLSALRELQRRGIDTKVLMLTMHKSEEYIRASLQAGARGFMLKDSSGAELLMAIHKVLAGKTFISSAVADRIVSAYFDRAEQTAPVRLLSDTLTAREKQVLKLVAEGRRNREIAEFLFVSVKTVEKHRANLMNKLDLHNTAALTAFALENAIATQ